jgi:hypothetical protein
MVKLTPLLRGILPTSLFDWAGKLFGVSTSMMHWKGHNEPASATKAPAGAVSASLPN